ncbi:MAG: hypothetical protein IKG92_07315 [Bacteroidales bacterium]|jgi:hypothetical protein|nr:hypothetical protein [Bacteroidales bacterium]
MRTDEQLAEQLYADIIGLPHPVSRRHKPMSMQDRAAQFAPFAALKGFDEEIDRTTEEEMNENQ